jgi:hypothetical protein
MTPEQAKLLRKQLRALYTADANLRAATDAIVVAAAGEYVNAKNALEATLASLA